MTNLTASTRFGNKRFSSARSAPGEPSRCGRAGMADPIHSTPWMASAEMVLQGVSVQLNTNCTGLAEYACDHFHDFARNAAVNGSHNVATSSDVTVNVLWVEPDASAPEQHQFQPTEKMQRIGRRVYCDEEQLLWLAPFTVANLQYRFRLDGQHLTVDAIYHFSPRPGKTADELALKRTRKYFSLMKHLVLYPVSWYLENFQSRYLLHASAVLFGDEAVTIAGVGGVGKTTTSLALLNEPHTKLLAENLLYYDQAHLYGCYEPIRVDSHSLSLIGARYPALVPSNLLPILKEKQVYHLPHWAICPQAKAGPILIPTFGCATHTVPLDVGDALDKLLATNMQTREINAYYWFAATLALRWPKADRDLMRINQLKALLAQTQVYELHINPQSGLQPVIETILQHVSTRVEPHS